VPYAQLLGTVCAGWLMACCNGVLQWRAAMACCNGVLQWRAAMA
jgi:hypothetical protein